MKLLIIKLNAIGDVIFATPLAVALHQVWPEARIDWLVGRHAAPILRGHPLLSERIVFDGPFAGRGLGRLRGMLSTILRLRDAHYDVVFCLHRNRLAMLVARATRAPVRVGFSERFGRLLLTHQTPFRDDAHETERYLDLLRTLGHEVEFGGPCLGLTTESQVVSRLMLADHAAARPLIAIAPGGGRNPGTQMLIKRWPIEQFEALAARLAAETGGSIVAVGSPDEAELGERVAAAAGEQGYNACGRTSIPQLSALLAECDLVIANDSAPLHIAAAHGVPTVALFGPSDPRLVAPRGPRHRYLWAPPDCAPCYRPDNARSRTVWTCTRAGDELRCLRDVSVEAVVAAASAALAGVDQPAEPAL